MSNLSVEGKLKRIHDEQVISDRFKKREFVIETEEQYPQDIKFELIKDKTSAIDKFKENDTIKVSFNLRGNEYNGKYYVNLQAWRVEASAAGEGAPIPPPLDPMAEMPTTASTKAPAPSIDDIGEDDLPF